jgi:hypothetical protein
MLQKSYVIFWQGGLRLQGQGSPLSGLPIQPRHGGSRDVPWKQLGKVFPEGQVLSGWIERIGKVRIAVLIITNVSSRVMTLSVSPLQAMRWRDGWSKRTTQWLDCDNWTRPYVFPISKRCWALIGLPKTSRNTKKDCGGLGCLNEQGS